MIVPMKKVAIIMQKKDAEGGIKAMRTLGVVHVEHQQLPKEKNISLLQEDLALADQALEVISGVESFQKYETKEQGRVFVDWRQTARHIIDLWKRLDHLEEYSRTLIQQTGDWQAWGDFDPQGIRSLAENGIYVRLYQIPKKELEKLPQGVIVEKIAERAGMDYCAVISREKIDCGFKELELPKLSLGSMQKRLSEDKKIIDEIKIKLNQYCFYRGTLLEVKESLEKEAEFQEALNGMGQEANLTYLVGYAPAENEEELADLAEKEKWGIRISDPSGDDNVPVFLRNPKWISLINPVMKFLEILPGYRELDISLPFLIFFSIFFGILIGDAGYGLVYSLITFLLQQKARKMHKDTGSFFLFYILSFCAIIWGILTGTFFGHEWVLKAGYKPLLPVLTDEKGLQRFCFFVGALHLSIAHGWRAILKAPSLSAVADLGWIGLLWAAFFIARMLILGDNFPFFGKWLIIAGVSCVVLFTNPQKNILKTIGEGLGTLALSLMNSFTDVVSYVRLFAVGLAGVAIADAFNAMAVMVGTGNVFAILLAAMIAIIGNALGIILGPVSVLVHGIRLNVLEFSGHANVSWSGLRYQPLKE